MWGGGGGGMGGGWAPWGGHGPGGRAQWMAQQGLRRSVDAWDDEELGAAYNHEVTVRLLRYVKPYLMRALISTIGVVTGAILLNYQPAIISDAVNAAVAGDTNTVVDKSLILLVMVLIGWGAQYTQLSQAGFIGHRVLLKLRQEMFAHLQKLSLRFYDNNEVGRVMSRVQNDVTSMQELLSSGFLTVFGDIIGLAVIVYVVTSRNMELALVTFSVVPILIIVTFFWQIYARRAFMRVRQAIAIVNSNLQENVSGVRVIQSLSREDVNAERFSSLNEDNMRANIEAGRLQAAIMPMVELISAAATALVMIYGGHKVLQGQLNLGNFVLFIFSINLFFQPIRELVLQYTQLQRAMAGGVRVFEVLDTHPDIEDDPDAVDLDDIRGEVTFDHVDFDYVEGVPVLRNISIEAHPGETIALVGATGAGKTTLTALILRFYEVTRGSIRIDGIELKKIKRSSLTRRTGVVLQDPFLFSGTVKENILYGRLDATDDEVTEAAKAVGAHDFIMKLDHGYDTALHERGQNLSVGQRQLISFARAVLARPRILILDEATANVDTRTEVVIQKALRELLKDRTSFVIAHRLSTIREATRIIVLEHGQIMEMGTHDELLAKDGIYANLYRMTYERLEEPTEGAVEELPLS
ncbi:MAG TPA: ABC transporter ATP-binding protein [Dehalococcoidia bacterium]|nr:ABC transporter ATP-binding protein [Dehalococcoidia bacterium]